MIHNGLEYAQMQLLAELIQLSSDPKKLFQYIQENGGDSFLLRTAQKVVQNKETLSKIEDKATAKGTGSWTIKTAQDLGVAMPMVESAVFARFLSHIPKLSDASDKKVANQLASAAGPRKVENFTIIIDVIISIIIIIIIIVIIIITTLSSS